MNKTQKDLRATRADIFAHLVSLLGVEAENVAKEVAAQAIAGDRHAALEILNTYDATLGGIGIFSTQGKKLPGLYRAFTYVALPLRSSTEPHSHTRSMVYSSGCYLEDLLKKMVRLGFLDKARDNLPLGALLQRAQKQLHPDLYADLDWLNSKVHVFAKHDYDMNDREDPEQHEHFFDLDEAIAVYLIARKLGLELERISGIPTEELIKW